MMIKKLKKTGLIAFLILLAVVLLGRPPRAVAGDIIEILAEAGPAGSLPNGSGISYPLFAETGQGRAMYSDIVLNLLTNDKIEFNCTVTLIVNHSGNIDSLTAHHCPFVANNLTGILDPIVTTPFSIYLNQCDPINPSDVSGRYVGATELKYRGVIEGDVESNGFGFRLSRSSGFEVIR
jgi:hypothetical protein